MIIFTSTSLIVLFAFLIVCLYIILVKFCAAFKLLSIYIVISVHDYAVLKIKKLSY